MRKINLIYFFFFIIIFGGCYPIYKTVRPKSQVLVTNQNNEPLKGATVYLLTDSYPYHVETYIDEAITNEEGYAYFEKKKDFRFESLLMHGSNQFEWDWCIFKENYQTHLTKWTPATFSKNYKVQLIPGVATECPKPPYKKERNVQSMSKL